jgi:hypothetical protein
MNILKNLIYISMVSCHLLANSQVTQEIVNLKTRDDVTMRVLLLSPKEPKATLILFAGGHGGLRIFPNGSLQWGENNFLIRTKSIFAELGVNVAIVDAPSDRLRPPFLSGFRNSEEHFKDIKALTILLKNKYSVPIWLVGTSRGTESAASIGIKLQDENEVKGIVLTSSILIGQDGNPIPNMALNKYNKPVLIVHHEKDECIVTKFSDLSKLSSILNPNNRNEVVIYSEGITQGDACQAMSHHGFNGIEQKVVSKIVDWVVKN